MMCGVEVGEPISSSGLAMKVIRSNGRSVIVAAGELPERRQRPEAGEQAGLHVRHPRALRDPVLDLERPLRDRALLEDGVHVPDEQDPWPGARPALERADDRLAEPPCGVGPPLDASAHRLELGGDPRPDLVDALRRVAAAVDRAEPLEVGEEGRQAGLDGRLDRVELVGGDERARARR